MRLNIGCGEFPIDGFTNIDFTDEIKKPGFDYNIFDVTVGLPYNDNSVEFIVCHHFLEHVTYTQGNEFLRECNRVLKPGGKLSLVVPDFFAVVKRYSINPETWLSFAEMILYPKEKHGQFHQATYDVNLLKKIAESAGFKVDYMATNQYLVANVDWQVGVWCTK